MSAPPKTPAPGASGAAKSGAAKSGAAKSGAAAPAPANPMLANPMVVNMIYGALRPHVPEYTDVVMTELAKPENQKGFKEAIRTVVQDGVKNTFGAVNMTTHAGILKEYGCADGSTCEQ